MAIEFTIPVHPVTKKNHPQIVWKKQPFQIRVGKFVVATIPYTPFIIPSKGYREFEKECLPYLHRVKNEAGIINYPVNAECKFYVAKQLKYDLTNLLEAIDDAAVKSGLLLDDNRDIIAGHDFSRVLYDKYNPRIKVKITKMVNYEQWRDTTTKQQSLFE